MNRARLRVHATIAFFTLSVLQTPLLAQNPSPSPDVQKEKQKDDQTMQGMPGMPGMKQSDMTPGKVTVTGLADLYYQYSFNHPPAGSNLFGRAWDVKHDSFSLSLLEVSIMRCADEKVPVMLTGVFNIGKTADLVHATEPGGTSTYKYIQQLYATYTTGKRHPVTIDVGKFQAWACYDNIESISTDNYSRGLLYMMGEPFYHAGVRASVSLNPKWTASLYLVNGWNEMEDANGGKTLGGSLMYSSGGPVSFMLSWIGGDEGGDTKNPAGTYGGIGYMMPGVLNTQMLNFNATWRPTDRLKFVLNTDYASASKSGMMGGHWNGQGIVARYELSPTWAIAVRGEHFEDTDGLKSGFGQNMNSLTATVEHRWRDSFITRLEYRHDHAGMAMFPTANDMSKNQDTITLGQVVRF